MKNSKLYLDFLLSKKLLSFLWKFSIIKKIMDLFDEIFSLTPNNPDNSTDGSKKSELNRFK